VGNSANSVCIGVFVVIMVIILCFISIFGFFLLFIFARISYMRLLYSFILRFSPVSSFRFSLFSLLRFRLEFVEIIVWLRSCGCVDL